MERSNEGGSRWMHRAAGSVAARFRERERAMTRSAGPASARGMPSHPPAAGGDPADYRALADDAVHRAEEVVSHMEADQREIDRLRRDTRLLLEPGAA